MKIELKNFKVNETFSQETLMFNANLYVDGVHVGYCKNDGQGGNTDVSQKSKDSLVKVEEYCKSLPPIICGTLLIDMNLENYVDDLVEQKMVEKDLKKLEKKMLQGILYGKPNNYSMISWKGMELKQVINHPQMKLRVIKLIKELKEKGETILNTNLPDEVIN